MLHFNKYLPAPPALLLVPVTSSYRSTQEAHLCTVTRAQEVLLATLGAFHKWRHLFIDLQRYSLLYAAMIRSIKIASFPYTGEACRQQLICRLTSYRVWIWKLISNHYQIQIFPLIHNLQKQKYPSLNWCERAQEGCQEGGHFNWKSFTLQSCPW